MCNLNNPLSQLKPQMYDISTRLMLCRCAVTYIFQVLKAFPETLRADICLHINWRLIQRNSAFKYASPGERRVPPPDLPHLPHLRQEH